MTVSLKFLFCLIAIVPAISSWSFFSFMMLCSSTPDPVLHTNDDGKNCFRVGSQPSNNICFAGKCWQKCKSKKDCVSCLILEVTTKEILVKTLNDEKGICASEIALQNMTPILNQFYDLVNFNGVNLSFGDQTKNSSKRQI